MKDYQVYHLTSLLSHKLLSQRAKWIYTLSLRAKRNVINAVIASEPKASVAIPLLFISHFLKSFFKPLGLLRAYRASQWQKEKNGLAMTRGGKVSSQWQKYTLSLRAIDRSRYIRCHCERKRSNPCNDDRKFYTTRPSLTKCVKEKLLSGYFYFAFDR
jgi:hypothetical protein